MGRAVREPAPSLGRREPLVHRLDEAVGHLEANLERESDGELDFGASDSRSADVVRLHPRRRIQLVKDQIAIARPEDAGRGGERMGLPTQAGVDRQGPLGAQIWIRLRRARVEIQFREGGRAEGDSSASSHLEGFDSGAQKGSRAGAQARTESGHCPNEVEPQCRIHGERSPQERSVVGDPQRDDLAAVDSGVASC